jgi:hypothetical protein
METIIDALSDGVIDTLKLVPFLLVTYVVMELLEHGASAASERFVRDAGHAGPVVGAVLGALPQCGFSAMAATLYAGRVVTLGTLLAVFLSTSDEMLPVFIASQAPLPTMAAILGSKVALGLVAGLAIDATLRALHRAGDGRVHIHELCERAHCHCEDEKNHRADEVVQEVDAASCGTCVHADHEHGASHARVWSVMRSAFVHTLQVSFFILLVSVVLDIVISLVGTDAFAAVAAQHPVRATLLAGLVGLIPNCGASVAISELYLTGSLGAGAMFAGLSVSGGVGLLVLFRTNSSARENLLIMVLLYAVGVTAGLLVGALGITF